MRTLKEESIPKLGKKINQLKKRIERTKISGRTEKVEFRKSLNKLFFKNSSDNNKSKIVSPPDLSSHEIISKFAFPKEKSVLEDIESKYGTLSEFAKLSNCG